MKEKSQGVAGPASEAPLEGVSGRPVGTGLMEMPDLVGHDNMGGAGLERGEGFSPPLFV